jgi:hypothetical protein
MYIVFKYSYVARKINIFQVALILMVESLYLVVWSELICIF